MMKLVEQDAMSHVPVNQIMFRLFLDLMMNVGLSLLQLMLKVFLYKLEFKLFQGHAHHMTELGCSP